MGLRLASEHLAVALGNLESAVAQLEAASLNLASKKRRRLQQSLEVLCAEIESLRVVRQKVSRQRERNRLARLERAEVEVVEDVITDIFEEAQDRQGVADHSRDSLGDVPPSWENAVRRLEEQ